MNLSENFEIPSSIIIQDNIETIDLKGFSIFEKKENLFDSLIMGVPLKYIMVGVSVWVILKKKLKNT